MFSDILLTVDCDHTLTDIQSNIPQRNLDAIRWFIERGGTKPFLGDLDWAEGAMALPTGESVKVMVRKCSDGTLAVDIDAPKWVRIRK